MDVITQVTESLNKKSTFASYADIQVWYLIRDARIFGLLSFMRAEVEKSPLSICSFRVFIDSTKL